MYVLSRVGDLLEGESSTDPPAASFTIAVVPSSGPPKPLILQFAGTASPEDWVYAWSATSPKTSAELSWKPGTSTPVEIPVASGARQISIFVRAVADDLEEGVETLELSLASTGPGSAPQNASIRIQEPQTALPPGARIVLQADADAVGEGETASFTIYTQGLSEGTVLRYRVEGLSASDLDSATLSGSATVDVRGMARVLLPIRNDSTAEGTETIALRLTGAPGQIASQLVLDTSAPIADYSNLPSEPTSVWFAPTSARSTLGFSTILGVGATSGGAAMFEDSAVAGSGATSGGAVMSEGSATSEGRPTSASGATLLLSNTLQGGTDPADYIRFSVPASQRLNRLALEHYDSVDGVAFIALERGMRVTATEANPGPLIGYAHFGTGVPGLGEGADLLPRLGGPLEAGDYSLWIQQVGAATSYRFRLTSVPTMDGAVRVAGRIDDEVLFGGSLADSIDGGAGNDLILGREGDDSISGGAGDDTLFGGAGNDRIDGGSSMDVAVYPYARGSYAIGLLDQKRSVSFLSKAAMGLGPMLDEGVDSLSGVERIQFADRSIAYDLDGNAGKTAKIIGAVFGKDAVSKADYVGIGLFYLEKLNFSDEDLMQLAITAALGGAPTAERYRALVDLLYTNVVGSKPSEPDAMGFVQLLSDKVYSPAGLGLFAAETARNALNINLAGLASEGLEYLPFAG